MAKMDLVRMVIDVDAAEVGLIATAALRTGSMLPLPPPTPAELEEAVRLPEVATPEPEAEVAPAAEESEAAEDRKKHTPRATKHEACEVCGRPFVGHPMAKVCGPTCRKQRQAYLSRESWRRKHPERRTDPGAGPAPKG